MTDTTVYLHDMTLNFTDETPADKMVAMSLAMATYHHCTVFVYWHGKMQAVNENSDMRELLNEAEEWDS